ncbi:MAG: TrkA family potassium uptake protein [Eubacteriales bacterium]|nr:TrkA family potassium uptake protein [Eubacteriales bacterium]
MSNKTYAVLGLGKFGMAVARELSDLDCDVIAVDMDEEIVKMMSREVDYAVAADVTDKNAMKEIGLADTDAVFISIAEDLEASILAALIAKELGVKQIIAKASSYMHGKVLDKIGVTRVLYPEREMGRRMARNIVAGNFLDMIDLSREYSLVEIKVPEKWIGETILGLNVRQKYGLNIVAMKRGEDIFVNIDPNKPFAEHDVLIVVGSNTAISELGE